MNKNREENQLQFWTKETSPSILQENKNQRSQETTKKSRLIGYRMNNRTFQPKNPNHYHHSKGKKKLLLTLAKRREEVPKDRNPHQERKNSTSRQTNLLQQQLETKREGGRRGRGGERKRSKSRRAHTAALDYLSRRTKRGERERALRSY